MDETPSSPSDIETALNAAPAARQAFERLPPSHRREYFNWIAEAKRPATREARIDGLIARLLESR